jgi:Co/Zn/Cd efflux system component
VICLSRVHSHEGDGSHDHHDEADKPRPGDAADRTFGRAMAVFGLLGAAQLVTALVSGRIALAVDGLHNIGEVPTLGVNRKARKMEQRVLGRIWTCWILPLAPTVSSLLSVVGAAVLLALARNYQATEAIWLAFGLELASLAANGLFAKKFHAGHTHDDANVATAVAHLAGDSAVSGLGMLAYLIIGLSGGNTLLDPIAAVVGVVIIVGVHLKPIRNSLREFRKHRQPGHECKSNHDPAHVH